METRRMYAMLALAKHTADTNEWYERDCGEFRDDEEYKAYVVTAYEIMRFPDKNVIWEIPGDVD